MDVANELKVDRTLWDGTRVMSDDEGREKWESFLKEVENAEKEAQREKELDCEAVVGELVGGEDLCVLDARFVRQSSPLTALFVHRLPAGSSDLQLAKQGRKRSCSELSGS